MNPKDLQVILDDHKLWLSSDYKKGKRADLNYANLSNANLSNADLNNANLFNAYLYNADLSNADLNNANLSYADLIDANLSNADLYNANLSNADLYNANLSNADLYNADLSYANLIDANLSYADLRNANTILMIKDTCCITNEECKVITYYSLKYDYVVRPDKDEKCSKELALKEILEHSITLLNNSNTINDNEAGLALCLLRG